MTGANTLTLPIPPLYPQHAADTTTTTTHLTTPNTHAHKHARTPHARTREEDEDAAGGQAAVDAADFLEGLLQVLVGPQGGAAGEVHGHLSLCWGGVLGVCWGGGFRFCFVLVGFGLVVGSQHPHPPKQQTNKHTHTHAHTHGARTGCCRASTRMTGGGGVGGGKRRVLRVKSSMRRVADMMTSFRGLCGGLVLCFGVVFVGWVVG
jgi:hypothetical protein